MINTSYVDAFDTHFWVYDGVYRIVWLVALWRQLYSILVPKQISLHIIRTGLHILASLDKMGVLSGPQCLNLVDTFIRSYRRCQQGDSGKQSLQ